MGMSLDPGMMGMSMDLGMSSSFMNGNLDMGN